MEKASVERQGQTKEKPKILPLHNGPYYLLNDMEPKVVENLNSKGEPLSMVNYLDPAFTIKYLSSR